MEPGDEVKTEKLNERQKILKGIVHQIFTFFTHMLLYVDGDIFQSA